MRHAARLSSALALAAHLTLATSAFAQVSADDGTPPANAADAAKTARDRYNAGLQAYGAHRYREAALNFEAASAAVPSAVALYTAGLAWELSDQPERAADDFSRCIALPGLPADKATNAKDRLTALETLLGRVEVTAPDGWRVQLDSNTEAPTPAVLHGSAGMHTVTIHPQDKPFEKRSVTLTIGQAVKLDLTAPSPEPKKTEPEKPPVTPPPPPPKVEPPPDDGSGTKLRRGLGFVAIGFGGAAIASGIVLGLQANDARDAYNARPSQQGFDHANGLATWTTLALIGGAVFAAGGIVLVVWPSSPAKVATPSQESGAPHDEKVEDPTRNSSLVVVPTLGGALLRGTF